MAALNGAETASSPRREGRSWRVMDQLGDEQLDSVTLWRRFYKETTMNRKAFGTELRRFVDEPDVLAQELKDDGVFPNSKLQLLLYRGAVVLPEQDPAAVFEQLFAANGWHGSWR